MGNVKVKIQAVIELEADRDFSTDEKLSYIKKTGTREALDNLNKLITDSKLNIRLVKSPSVCSFVYVDKF